MSESEEKSESSLESTRLRPKRTRAQALMIAHEIFLPPVGLRRSLEPFSQNASFDLAVYTNQGTAVP